jgi:hypothetical protein
MLIQIFFNFLASSTSDRRNCSTLILKYKHVTDQMQEFKDDVDITKFACDMLKSLSSFENLTRKPMVDAKAAIALANAIERHGDNPDIQKQAREAMKQLVRK